LSNNSKTNDLTRIILEVINEEKPQSVKHLTKMLKESLNLAEEEIIESILKLQAKGVLKLKEDSPQSWSLATYLKTGEAVWYWVTITAGVLTAVLVFTISESIYPWIIARNVLGVIFVLFLPGYALMKTLFPTNMHAKTSIRGLEEIERIALCIGISIALVSIIGLLLYYSPWGLDLTTVVPTLLAFTSVFATAAVVKEYQQRKPTWMEI